MRPIFKTVFHKDLVLLSIQNSKMFRHMCKLHHKVRNGQYLPNENPNLRNYFFLCNFTDNLSHDSTNLISIFQAPGYLESCENFLTNCRTPKIEVHPWMTTGAVGQEMRCAGDSGEDCRSWLEEDRFLAAAAGKCLISLSYLQSYMFLQKNR